MISSKAKIPNSLKIKLSKYNMDNIASQLVNRVSEDVLLKVREYGEGTAGGNEPTGGAPYWQGEITVKGHRRGYLSDSHYIKRVDNYNTQIASSAEFTDGVINGYSTNWRGVTFRPNPYHKRAVDKFSAEKNINAIWRELVKGGF